MLGITSLLALIGLLIVLVSVVLMFRLQNRNLAFASFVTGLLLVFVPSTLVYLFLN